MVRERIGRSTINSRGEKKNVWKSWGAEINRGNEETRISREGEKNHILLHTKQRAFIYREKGYPNILWLALPFLAASLQ